MIDTVCVVFVVVVEMVSVVATVSLLVLVGTTVFSLGSAEGSVVVSLT